MLRDTLGIGGLIVATIGSFLLAPAAALVTLGAALFLFALLVLGPVKKRGK